MRHSRCRWPAALLLCVSPAIGISVAAPSRDLTFEERVEAQVAIERVYYAHQIGAMLPFEQAVPHALIEKKVRAYLKASDALETWWSTEVSATALQRETERMARDSRMPVRLSELHAALGNDSLLIQECLARPALVNRLTRRFFEHDERIHEAAQPGLVPGKTWEEWWQEVEGGLDESRVAAVADGTWTVPQPSQVTGCDPEGDWLRGGLEDSPDPSASSRAAWTGSELIVWGTWARHRYDPAIDTWSSISLDGAPDLYVIPQSLTWTGTVVLSWSGGASTSGRYNPFLDSWQPVSPVNAPAGTNSSVWTGTQLLVWGGSAAKNKKYDPVTDVWTNMSTAGQPPFRSAPGLVWTGTEMIVWGGYTASLPSAYYEWPGGRYNPATDTWSPMSEVGAPQKREQHSAVWTGARMVIWGGARQLPPGPPPPPSEQPYSAYGDGKLYDPQTDTWEPLSSVNAPSLRYAHNTVWTGNRMIVWGGRWSQFLNDGASYDPVTDTWTPTSLTNVPAARAYNAFAWTGSLLMVWGGRINDSPGITATGGRYDPSSDTWTPIDLTGAPSARTQHSAVWTGNEMIVWGGSPWLTGTALGTGARFDPALGTWSSVTMVNAPLPREGHTAVWTGSEMIVWGGFNYNGGLMPYHKSGGRYDPISDSWTATKTGNAPSERYRHSAVWTGSEMIVWGGTGQQGAVSTGGRYDPAHDNWSATATLGAPSARYLHAAVWTGSQMVVWGGYSGGPPAATGGRYDPAANSWVPMATTTLAVTRGHSVWTGSEMLIWEGTGRRYNPVADTWSNIASTTNLVGSDFSMAWSGEEMIVWGGIVGSTRVNTGMRYKPATDSWSPTTTANAPSGRSISSALWAGNALLVWGGEQGHYLRSGGAYTLPSTVDADGDGFMVCEDCADDDPAVYPGAPQVCGDGLNNNCGDPAWPGLSGTNDGDDDGDGFSTCAGDCDDALAVVQPGGAQLCDGINNDCDSPEWPTPPANEADQDTDGVRLCAGDCNDTQAIVRPGAPQLCDGINNDCNAPGWPAPPADEADQDGDGHRICAGDCDDTRSSVKPGAAQVCGDGLNNDCNAPGWPSASGTNEGDDDADGLTECAGDCDDALGAVWPGAPQVCDGINNDCGAPGWPAVPVGEVDQDGDGVRLCAGDCDNTRSSVWPGAPQVCDGLNNDCSDPTWPALPASEIDQDGDSFAPCSGDCDESRASVRPGGFQLCADGLNNNCAHPGWPSLAGTNESDDDADGPTECGGDCDDSTAATHPGGIEVNDGKDNHCAGDPGFGLVDELEGEIAFPNAADTTTICWPAQPGAASYVLARGEDPTLALGQSCGAVGTSACDTDSMTPAPGGILYYLVRAQSPFTGSWGRGSSGSEAVVSCSTPETYEFSFTDTALADDVGGSALLTFFNGMPAPAPSSYMLFQVEGSAGSEAWCAERPDFYRNNYLGLATGGSTVTSGSWNKWYRTLGSGWTGPVTDGYINGFGTECTGAYSWCSEWGLGSVYLAVNPASTGACEVSDDNTGCGGGLTIRVGPSRMATCGF